MSWVLRPWENYTGHGIGEALNDFIGSQNSIRSQIEEVMLTEKCRYCSSEYVVMERQKRREERSTIKRKGRIFQVDQYIDFGECLPTDVMERNAVMKQGMDCSIYGRV
jgi:hypothetical protein